MSPAFRRATRERVVLARPMSLPVVEFATDVHGLGLRILVDMVQVGTAVWALDHDDPAIAKHAWCWTLTVDALASVGIDAAVPGKMAVTGIEPTLATMRLAVRHEIERMAVAGTARADVLAADRDHHEQRGGR